ncbi:ROK family protein [Brachybacterium sacelli]|uniref:Glucokinase n=1 Tax=Brachybacterium sacelli TaxID=173364 RepID=A0ABS4WYN5_9MICO|nr:ROK family protein [Brachybacterium sacelli]MBP2381314.1 glucokinase [Brachybacterium sacelli]
MSGRVLSFEPPASREGSFLALELLPGRVHGALIDPSGRFRARRELTFDPSGSREEIMAGLDRVATGLARSSRLGGCVLSAGGVLDTARGRMVQVVDMPALEGCAVADHLSALVDAPALLEHRARLQVHGDHYFGAGQGEETFASVATGGTLGVGILYQGMILAPDGGRSGAHMTVASRQLECSCGKYGCWRTIATTAWLRQQGRELGMIENDLASWERRAVEDPRAAAVVGEYAENLALGLANIQQLCMPGLFILHGEAARASAGFRERILATLRDLSRTGGETEPRLATTTIVGDDATLLGGVALLLQRGVPSRR